MRKPQAPRKPGAAAPAYAQVAPETRRRMLAVRGRDTVPELRVRRILHAMGYAFLRRHRQLRARYEASKRAALIWAWSR